MMKKIFGMAAISALGFGMFACSDGEDGMDGVNGKDGSDGISCSVKALKDSSGFKVLCDGDSVGVLLNAADGKAGKDGKAGTDGKDGKDGEDGADGNSKNGENGKDGAAGKNGTGCTAKAVTEGFKIICGTDTVGTLKNGTDGGPGGEGADGENCTLEDKGNGIMTVTCGDVSADLWKDVCMYQDGAGAVPYDPETHLCYFHKAVIQGASKNVSLAIPKCKDHSVISASYANKDRSRSVYDPDVYFCDKGVLVKQCKLHKEKEPSVDSIVTEFDSKTQYCDIEGNKVADKVPCSDKTGEEFYTEPGRYCYRKAGDPMTEMRYDDSLTCGLTNYSPVTHFCKNPAGDVLVEKSICAETPASADPFNIDIRYSTEFSADTSFICDTRDYQVYKVKQKSDGTVWMAEYLRYAYELPTYGFSLGAENSLETSSFCYEDDCSKGRYYLWSAVVDSATLAGSEKYCGFSTASSYTVCTFEAPFQGICPTGWHVPDQDEALYDPSLDLPNLGYYNALSGEWIAYGLYIELWSSKDVVGDGAYYYGYYPSKTGDAQFKVDEWGYKYKARPVLCIKNAPAPATP